MDKKVRGHTQDSGIEEKLFHKNFPHVKMDQANNGEKYMMSTDPDAHQTSVYMKAYCGKYSEDPRNLTIADAFACLGGNTYSFSNTFKQVDAYEIDPTRCASLQQNVNEYPEKAKVSVKYQDCLLAGGILDTQYDVVFLDPPWVNPEAKPPRVDGKVFDEAFTLCQKIAVNASVKYIFIKLPIKAKDNPDHDFETSLETLKEKMSALWDDVRSEMIWRRHSRGKNAAYTIVCARQKARPAHTPAAEASTSASSADPKQQMAILLSQLHTCQLLHENTQ
jgi:predicted RNA methylase